MEIKQHSFTTTNPLTPVGPAENLFISGASVFEITDFTPPVQRVTIVGINLPDPGIFGPYDTYVATLQVPDDLNPLASFILEPTLDNIVWAGTTLLDFGGTLPPINVTIRPQSFDEVQIGADILQGPVLAVDMQTVQPEKNRPY